MSESDQSNDQRTLLSKLPVAVCTTDAEGRLTFYNDAAAALWGRRPALGIDRWCGSSRIYALDGSPIHPADCPMAVALRDLTPRRTEIIIEREDGTRAIVMVAPIPLLDAHGKLQGGLNVLTDITADHASRIASHRLSAIVESSDDAIISKDLNGRITSWNKAAEVLFGYTPEEVIGQPIAIIIPENRLPEEATILSRLRRGERIDHFDTVRQRKDGSLIDISLTVSPIRDATGRVIGASKIARDISERKRAQDAQKLLLREMIHRVKNLFAVASGVVALSVRSAHSLQGLATAIQERLGALARAQDLTLPHIAERQAGLPTGTTLEAILQTIAVPFLDTEKTGRPRFQFDGPEVPVGPQAISGLALLLHELATNAAKYGALSVADGSVHVSWRSEGPKVLLVWTETGGPAVSEPVGGEGFGSVLARGTVQGQFGGTLTRAWRPEGLTVRIELDLARLRY